MGNNYAILMWIGPDPEKQVELFSGIPEAKEWLANNLNVLNGVEEGEEYTWIDHGSHHSYAETISGADVAVIIVKGVN